jgi:MFS family permease
MTLAHIVAMMVLAHLAFVTTRMTGSLYALAHHASTFTVGVQMALFALVPMLVAVPTGRWLDAAGPRKPLLIGFSMILGGALLPVLFPFAVADIAPLLVAAPLVGTGMMLVQMTTQGLVGERTEPGKRAAAFSWLALGPSASGLVGPVINGFLIDHFGHRIALAAFCALTVGSLLFLRRQWRHLASHATTPARPPAAPMFDLARDPDIRMILVITATISAAWDLQTLMVPVYGTKIGLNATEIGVVLGSFALATFSIRLAMPRLSRMFSEWKVLVFALFTSCLAYLCMPWFGGFWPLALCAYLLGLGLGAAQPNVMSLLHQVSPPGRVGESLGLRATIVNASSATLPLVFGALGSVTGAGAIFVLMAVMLGSVGGIAVRVRSKR